MRGTLNPTRRPRRPTVRRAVVMLPNGLTLFNLFCGIYAIVLAIRGEYAAAPGFILLGGIADTLDGRVARATGTGSRFGEELDSLVDAISFGFAPAMLVYLESPDRATWTWLLVFIFTACAVMRLARFNVEQAGQKKTHFHGLPSPAAGLTLATYYWFSQTPLYNQAVILFTDSRTLADLPWHTLLRGLMAMLAALMISDVPYPAVPSIGFSSIRKVFGTFVVAGGVVLLVVRREEFIFPALLAYVLYGAIKWVILGFIDRASTPQDIFWDDDADVEVDPEPQAAPRRSSRSADRPAKSRGTREPRDSREPRGAIDAIDAIDAIEATEPGAARSTAPLDPDDSPTAESRQTDGGTGARRKRRRRGGRGPRPSGSPPPGPQLPDTPTGSTE